MGDAAGPRPDKHEVLHDLTAELDADAEVVFAALLPLIDPGEHAGFWHDAATQSAVVQGGYWYRSEYTVAATDGDLALLRQVLVNVAAGPLLLGRLTGRTVIRRTPQAFADLVGRLRRVVE